METDLKVSTAHRCNSETLITKLTSNNTEDFVIPSTFLFKKFKSLPKLVAIKISQINTDVVALLAENFKNVSISLIISGDSLNSKTYKFMKRSVFKNPMLIVVSITKAQ